MTGLLVSVRSAAEAATALAGGADVIDVKEPSRGALGAADPSTWLEILQTVGGKAVISAALGEWTDESVVELGAQTAGFRFAKVGLSNWSDDGPLQWTKLRQRIPADVTLVPVVYADSRVAGWPSLSEALRTAAGLARDAKSSLILIDTYHKNSLTLLDFVSLAQLREILYEAAARRMAVALAGSLAEQAIEKLLPLKPAYIGVRGAACLGGRAGAIDLARVKSLARLVSHERQKAAS